MQAHGANIAGADGRSGRSGSCLTHTGNDELVF